MNIINKIPCASKLMKRLGMESSESSGDDDEKSLSSEYEVEEEEESYKEPSYHSYSSDFALPEEDQCIVRVTEITTKDVHQITTPKGTKHFVAVPKRLRQLLRVGNIVLIQPTAAGSEYLAEIVKLIDANYKSFYKANKLWPSEFDDAYVAEQAEHKTKKLKKMGLKKPDKTERAKKKDQTENTKKKDQTEKAKKMGTTEKAKKTNKTEKAKETEKVNENKMNEQQKKTTDGEQNQMSPEENQEKQILHLQKLLARVGSEIEVSGIDNISMTPNVVTKREPIVVHKDLLPIETVGELQPWTAILEHKVMDAEEMTQFIQEKVELQTKIAGKEKKAMMKEKEKLKKKGLTLDDDQEPCGLIKGQILIPWEKYAKLRPEGTTKRKRKKKRKNNILDKLMKNCKRGNNT